MTTQLALLPAPSTADPRAIDRPVGWGAYAALALAPVVLSVALAGRTTLFLVGALLIAAAVAANGVSAEPRLEPGPAALSWLIGLFVALPFARLPHDRVTSYALLLATVGTAGPALVRGVGGSVRGQSLLLWLFGVLAVTSAVSPDDGAVKALAAIAVPAVAVFLLAARLDALRMVQVCRTVVVLASVESALAIAEPWLFPAHLWESGGHVGADGRVDPLVNTVLTGLERSQGTMGHPLDLAMLLLLAMALLIRVLDDLPLGAACGVGALLTAGLVFTGSRSDIVGVAVLAVVGRRTTLVRVAVGAGVLLFALGALVSVGVLTDAPLLELLQSGSYTHRASAYSSFDKLAYTQSWQNTFFGNGFMSTQRQFATGRLQTDGFQVVDNQFVLTLSHGGIVSLLLLLALLGTALRSAGSRLLPAALVVVLTMLVFDTLLSGSAVVLTFLVLGLACRRQSAHA